MTSGVTVCGVTVLLLLLFDSMNSSVGRSGRKRSLVCVLREAIGGSGFGHLDRVAESWEQSSRDGSIPIHMHVVERVPLAVPLGPSLRAAAVTYVAARSSIRVFTPALPSPIPPYHYDHGYLRHYSNESRQEVLSGYEFLEFDGIVTQPANRSRAIALAGAKDHLSTPFALPSLSRR